MRDAVSGVYVALALFANALSDGPDLEGKYDDDCTCNDEVLLDVFHTILKIITRKICGIRSICINFSVLSFIIKRNSRYAVLKLRKPQSSNQGSTPSTERAVEHSTVRGLFFW